jgi:cell division protein FtsB
MISLNKKFIIRISVAVVFVAALAILFLHENGIIKYLNMKSEIRKIDRDIIKAEERLSAIEAEIDSLKTSKVKMEHVAREKFHMMKKSEKVFKVEEH